MTGAGADSGTGADELDDSRREGMSDGDLGAVSGSAESGLSVDSKSIVSRGSGAGSELAEDSGAGIATGGLGEKDSGFGDRRLADSGGSVSGTVSGVSVATGSGSETVILRRFPLIRACSAASDPGCTNSNSSRTVSPGLVPRRRTCSRDCLNAARSNSVLPLELDRMGSGCPCALMTKAISTIPSAPLALSG